MKFPGHLTAAELIDQLKQLPPETNVYVRFKDGFEVAAARSVGAESDIVHGTVAIIEWKLTRAD